MLLSIANLRYQFLVFTNIVMLSFVIQVPYKVIAQEDIKMKDQEREFSETSSKEVGAMPVINAEHKAEIQSLIRALDLEGHVEGGYFKETHKSDVVQQVNGKKRSILTSIYYLLTIESPVGHFHKNTSDIMHYFHKGDPITYFLIYPDGLLETRILGSDVNNGHELQLIVPGGVWKASKIGDEGNKGYGLIGEAVAPGFEYEDMELARQEQLMALFPQHKALIKQLTKSF